MHFQCRGTDCDYRVRRRDVIGTRESQQQDSWHSEREESGSKTATRIVSRLVSKYVW